MQDRAQTVIVGAGIVGASAAYHLAELGQTDVLVIDRGPLFETGGSTSHAPGLAFQTNGSRTMCRIAQDSVRLYSELDVDGEPCWYGVGGIEVATSEARMAELHRRRGWARSYGIEDTELLTPEQTAERIPLLDPSTILGSYLVPSDGIAKGVRIATALARRAGEKGVAFEGEVAVTGFDVAGGRVQAVLTDHGRIECERVLDLRRHLGADHRGDGRRPDPVARGPAPARVDRPARAAPRRVARDRPPDPAASGLRDVLPAARGSLRRRELPPRADRDPAVRAPRARRRPAAGADAVHARATSTTRRPRPRGSSRRWPGRCGRRTPPGRSTGCSRSPRTRARSSARARASAASGSARPSGSRTRVGWAGRSPSGSRPAGPATTWPRPTRTASTRSRRRRRTCSSAGSSSTARCTTSCIRSNSPRARVGCG